MFFFFKYITILIYSLIFTFIDDSKLRLKNNEIFNNKNILYNINFTYIKQQLF